MTRRVERAETGAITREQRDDDHFYFWHDEGPFVGVTGVISAGVPKPALKGWAQRVVAECAYDHRGYWLKLARNDWVDTDGNWHPGAVTWLKNAPFRTTDKAAVRGSHVHDWAEHYALGHILDVEAAPEGHRPYLHSYLQFIEDWSPTYELAEAVVYSRAHRYAGKLDAIATLRSRGTLLLDTKTSRGVWPETALQLAAYRFADFIGLPDGTEVPMPAVDGAAVLHLTPNGYELIPVQADEVTFRFFLYAMQIRAFRLEYGPRTLGEPLVPTRTEVA